MEPSLSGSVSRLASEQASLLFGGFMGSLPHGPEHWSELRFQGLADAVPSIVWFASADGAVRYLNRRWYEFTGQERGEAEDWTSAVHPLDAERVRRTWAEACASGVLYETELRYRQSDGSYRWHLARAEPLQDATGQISEWFGVSTDIHDRRLEEAALRLRNDQLKASIVEADALYRAYFEHTGDSLFVIRIGRDGDFVVEQTNAAHKLSTGLVDVEGRRLAELLPADTAAKVIAKYQEAVERKEPVSWRDEFRIGDRVVFWDTLVAPVLDEGGQVSRLFGSGRDVTQQVLAEESLRQAQKMQALGQLAGGIAHDFNNLLAAIVGSLDLLSRRAELDERNRRFLEGARTAADRGARLTGQLLAFSRSQRLELTDVSLGALLQRTEEMLRHALTPQISLSMHLPDDDLVVHSDPTQLELALLNLGINARDAMPGGGQLDVSCAAVTVAGDPALKSGDYVEIAVADRGAGMTRDVASRAFDPFFTTKGVGQGTGLGLSQVFGLARQAGGIARIETEPGKGTTVRLLLPRSRAKPVDSETLAVKMHPAAGRSLRVLVVDDDPDVRRFLVDALGVLGHAVEEAASGDEGLQRLIHNPQLLLVDFAMPGLDGADLVRAAKALSPETRAIMVSGYADSAKLEALDVPVLRKPFRVDQLHDLIEQVFSAA